jgi:hypothetical protein
MAAHVPASDTEQLFRASPDVHVSAMFNLAVIALRSLAPIDSDFFNPLSAHAYTSLLNLLAERMHTFMENPPSVGMQGERIRPKIDVKGAADTTSATIKNACMPLRTNVLNMINRRLVDRSGGKYRNKY